MLIEKLRGALTFKGCVQSFISGWEFILLTKLEDTNRNQVPVMAKRCRICRASFLAGSLSFLPSLRIQTGIRYQSWPRDAEYAGLHFLGLKSNFLPSSTIRCANRKQDSGGQKLRVRLPGTSFVGVSFIWPRDAESAGPHFST